VNKLLRKLRGVMGIGMTWGTLRAAIFAAISIVVWVIDPEDIDAFGILLSFADSTKPICDITLSRTAMWGILASAMFPFLIGRG